MSGERPTIDVALHKVIDGHACPVSESSSFVCPYPTCRVLAQHHWGVALQLTVFTSDGNKTRPMSPEDRLIAARCQACGRESIIFNNKLVSPLRVDAPAPTADMPENVLQDYEEAAQIYVASPRGAAALLRLAIQKLCVDLGSSEKDVSAAIGDLLNKGKITPLLQQALDSVRVIGNEAVHPGTMDLRDDQATALSLFSLINFIIEKAVTEPNQIAEIYQSLPPNKLLGIAQRDK